MVEVGIPFSDPVADGPVIQAAAQRALDAGRRVGDCFGLIAGFRGRHPDVPLGILTYANLVVARAGFMRDAAEAGADSLLIADVPALEASLRLEMEQAGIEPVLIAAANTPGRDAGAHRAAVEGLHLLRQSRGDHRHARGRPVRPLSSSSRLEAAGAPPPIFGFGISTARACPGGARRRRGGRHLRLGDRRLRGQRRRRRGLVRALKAATRNDSLAQ